MSPNATKQRLEERNTAAKPDAGVILDLRDSVATHSPKVGRNVDAVLGREVPLWSVRLAIVLVSSMIGACGATAVVIHQGGVSYDPSLWPIFGLPAVFSMVVGALLVLVPWFEDRPAVQQASVLLPVVAVVIISEGTWARRTVVGALTLSSILALPWIGRAARFLYRRLSDRLRRLKLARGVIAGVALLIVCFAVQIGATGTAVAQSAQRSATAQLDACEGSTVAFSALGNVVPLDVVPGSNPEPLADVITLDDDSTTIPFAAASLVDQPLVVTVELVKTWPRNLVGDNPRLLWHDVVPGRSTRDGEITIAKDGTLDLFTVSVRDRSGSLPAFGGVGTFRVTVRDGEAVCAGDVNVRIDAPALSTVEGLLATGALALGAAGVGSVLRSRRSPLQLPDIELTSVEIANDLGLHVVGANETASLSVNKLNDVTLSVTLARLDIDDDQLKDIKRRIEAEGRRSVTVLEGLDLVRGRLGVSSFGIEGGIVHVVVPMFSAEVTSERELVLEIAGVEIRTLCRFEQQVEVPS